MSSINTAVVRSLWAFAFVSCLVGCRFSDRTQEVQLPTIAVGSTTDPEKAVVPATLLTSAPPSQAGAFTISLATFIPANHVVAPAMHPQSFTMMRPQSSDGPYWLEWLAPDRLVFCGDDRSFDIDASRYRAKQVVTLVPDQAVSLDGLWKNSKQNLGGRTESFVASEALRDGKIDEWDRQGRDKNKPIDKGRVKALHQSIPVDTRGMLIDDPIRLGPNRVSVRLHTAASGGPRDQLITGAPSIDWDFTITIDTSGPEPKYELAGKWDGYPAMEIYVNRQPIYQHKGEDKPPTMGDLIKLAPLYGDLSVKEAGVLRSAN